MHEMSLKINQLQSQPHLPGTNEILFAMVFGCGTNVGGTYIGPTATGQSENRSSLHQGHLVVSTPSRVHLMPSATPDGPPLVFLTHNPTQVCLLIIQGNFSWYTHTRTVQNTNRLVKFPAGRKAFLPTEKWEFPPHADLRPISLKPFQSTIKSNFQLRYSAKTIAW